MIHLTPKLLCQSSYLNLTSDKSSAIRLNNVMNARIHTKIIRSLYTNGFKVLTLLVIPSVRNWPFHDLVSMFRQNRSQFSINILELRSVQMNNSKSSQIVYAFKERFFRDFEDFSLFFSHQASYGLVSS